MPDDVGARIGGAVELELSTRSLFGEVVLPAALTRVFEVTDVGAEPASLAFGVRDPESWVLRAVFRPRAVTAESATLRFDTEVPALEIRAGQVDQPSKRAAHRHSDG